MLDLVGNPEDRFSRDMAQLLYGIIVNSMHFGTLKLHYYVGGANIEPRHEKTCLLGFRLGLYNRRRWLEA